jgi:hypothetical protein
MFKFLGFHNRPEASPDVAEAANLAEEIKKYNIRFEFTAGKPGQPLEFVLVSEKTTGLTLDKTLNSPINIPLKNIQKKLNTVPTIEFESIFPLYGNAQNAGPGLKFTVAKQNKELALKALADLGISEFKDKSRVIDVNSFADGYEPNKKWS